MPGSRILCCEKHLSWLPPVIALFLQITSTSRLRASSLPSPPCMSNPPADGVVPGQEQGVQVTGLSGREQS